MDFFVELEDRLSDYWEDNWKNPKYILLGQVNYDNMIDSIKYFLPPGYSIDDEALVSKYKDVEILKVNRESFFELI